MLKVKVINFLGRKWANANIKLIKIDDNFYHNPEITEGKTNDKGIANFNISVGTYFIEVSTKKVVVQKIITTEADDTFTVRMPSLFGFIKMEKIVSEGFRNKFYEKARTDYEKCFFCKKHYEKSVAGSFADRFKCRYCEKYYCYEHRIPENHKCWGNPRAPHVNFTEIHHGSGRVEVIVHG